MDVNQALDLIELRLKAPVNNASVMSGEGERKEWDRLKGPNPHPYLPHILSPSAAMHIIQMHLDILEIIPRMSFSAVNVIVFKYLTENIFIFLNLNSIFQT